jgi:TROVE domain
MTVRLTDKEQWEILIQEMGYMALLRNLRNFDKVGIGKNHANRIAQFLSDPDEVAKSKQLPFRFYTAWMNTPSGRWKTPLDKALQASIPNIPSLDGRSLILIDTSGSMQGVMGTPNKNRGTGWRPKVRNISTGQEEETEPNIPRRVDAGALFGLALAMRNKGKVDVWGFADGQMAVTNLINSGKSLLETTELFGKQIGAVGHGTQIERAVRDTYKGQDRVFIFTDMQTVQHERAWPYSDTGDVTRAVPQDKQVYGFDLAGYKNSAIDVTPTRHEMGGLTDHTFGAIPLIEAGVAGVWPWE